MDTLEKFIRENSIYSPTDETVLDTDYLIKNFNLERKYMGQLSRVYLIDKYPWVMKEGRWDIKLELVKPGIPFPQRIVEVTFDKLFNFTFVPNRKEVMRQYKLYLEFVQYLGFFKDDKTYYHPNRDLIFVAQKNIRNSLLFFKPELEKEYKIKINPKIDDIFSDEKVKYHNFLPKEYQAVGKSIAPENKSKLTSLMFQEFVEGKLLYDVGSKKLEILYKKQLILMIYLILLMQMQIRILPDTRPRYNFLQAYDWLTKTDNIKVSDEGLKFIDTRWFWDTKSFSYLVLPTVVSNLVIAKARVLLNQLLDEV